MKVTHLTRRYEFRTVHSLPANTGVCSARHGHNYLLEATVEGPLEAQAQWVLSRDRLDQIVNEKIINQLDRRELTQVLTLPVSGEALAQMILTTLKNALPGHWIRVALQETRKNRFVVSSP